MLAQVPSSGFKVVERRLRVAEQQLHETAGGVVHEHEQRATLAAVLEPLVVAAIDLNELTQARSAPARLVYAIAPASVRHPQTILGHPLPQRLLGHATLLPVAPAESLDLPQAELQKLRCLALGEPLLVDFAQ
jgi:hypothetical protein